MTSIGSSPLARKASMASNESGRSSNSSNSATSSELQRRSSSRASVFTVVTRGDSPSRRNSAMVAPLPPSLSALDNHPSAGSISSQQNQQASSSVGNVSAQGMQGSSSAAARPGSSNVVVMSRALPRLDSTASGMTHRSDRSRRRGAPSSQQFPNHHDEDVEEIDTLGFGGGVVRPPTLATSASSALPLPQTLGRRLDINERPRSRDARHRARGNRIRGSPSGASILAGGDPEMASTAGFSGDGDGDGGISTRDYVKALNTQNVHMDEWWKILLLMAALYGLPTLQALLEDSATDDQCFFNRQCQFPVGSFTYFNAVISKTGYVIGGLSYILFARFAIPEDDGLHGLETKRGLHYALGVAMCFQGLFGTMYHLCPTLENRHHDTTFIVTAMALTLVALYQKRNVAQTASAVKIYAYIIGYVSLNYVGLNIPSNQRWLFWVIVAGFVGGTAARATHFFFFQQKMNIKSTSIKDAKAGPGKRVVKRQPFPARVFGVSVNLALIVATMYGFVRDPPLGTYAVITLFILYSQYLAYYTAMKVFCGETIQKPSVAFYLSSLTFWALAGVCYLKRTSDVTMSLEESNSLNEACIAGIFDIHDLFHFSASIALVCGVCSVLIMDRDLKDDNRNTIVVF